ncbi:MAG: hypothetical protein Q4F72_04955, partial [Desulfovibrionaceae bacterium]|nr:hypothetical protein [Desulfovibrionaceae bacterium]
VQKYLTKLDDGIPLNMVLTLSLFLALAEALDKGHSSVVTDARFMRQGRKLALSVNCTQAAPLEKSRVQRCEERMQAQFGQSAALVFHEPPQRHLAACQEGRAV